MVTSGGGFWDAIEKAIENLGNPDDFHSMFDIALGARQSRDAAAACRAGRQVAEPAMTNGTADNSVEQARANFEAAARDIDLHQPGRLPLARTAVRDLRRSRRPGASAATGSISLVERNGLLFWTLGPSTPPGAGDQRRFRVRPFGRTLARRDFVALGQNEIGTYLEKLDLQLTPQRD